MSAIPSFPHTTPLTLEHHAALFDILVQLEDGVSEFSFANLYLFRKRYHYRLCYLPDRSIAIQGKEGRSPFWLVPQGVPPNDILQQMVAQGAIKCVPQRMATHAHSRCQALGLVIVEDRDNFDYLYLREDLATLKGRRLHKKRNFVNYFTQNYAYRHIPIGPAEVPLALQVLQRWRKEQHKVGDFYAAHEALHNMAALHLCGYLTIIDTTPCGVVIGESMARGNMFVIHFEKATVQYRGIYQYINKAFAETLPKHYTYINREQDLGDPGLRQAKMTYRPARFVEKYRIKQADH